MLIQIQMKTFQAQSERLIILKEKNIWRASIFKPLDGSYSSFISKLFKLQKTCQASRNCFSKFLPKLFKFRMETVQFLKVSFTGFDKSFLGENFLCFWKKKSFPSLWGNPFKLLMAASQAFMKIFPSYGMNMPNVLDNILEQKFHFSGYTIPSSWEMFFTSFWDMISELLRKAFQASKINCPKLCKTSREASQASKISFKNDL